MKKKNPKKQKTTTKNGGAKMLMTEAHSNKGSSHQHWLTEVKTKEYRHSECAEKYNLHWN